MRRTDLDCPEIPQGVISQTGYVEKKIEIEIITPLFGGGVEPGENDPITLIRGTSIRGQLRFWWRATLGANCKSVSELRKREGEIWGTTEKPSSVNLRVKILDNGKEEICAQYSSGKKFPKFTNGYPGYALFPFQGDSSGKPPSIARKNIKFEIILYFLESQSKEVEASLWAWLNFGGIGARSRRGCGALYCKDFAPKTANVSELSSWFKENKKKFNIPPSLLVPQGWPTLGSTFLVKEEVNVFKAWEDAVNLMYDFRQKVSFGRSSDARNLPGRSRWPEADSLRAITGKGAVNHKIPSTIEARLLKENPAFPRAELGLPIIFHFKDQADSPNNSELYSVNSKRMSSPIILRPLAVNDGKKAVPMFFVLNTVKPDKLKLKIEGKEHLIDTLTSIRRQELANYENSPMRDSEKGSALESLVSFAKKQNFKEVQL
jgi:CRISPR-associated protein Cmr1